MKRLGRIIGIGAALSLLVVAGPVDSAAAAQEDPPAKVEGGYAEDPRADVAGLPPRKRPTTPAGTPARQSNARARQVTCGQVITQNTVLRNDVGPCPGDGIVIGADNIFLNLNGHRVLGNSDHGASGEFAGIRLTERTGVTVTGRPGGQTSGQMATVSGFEAGVLLDRGSGNTVSNIMVRDNIGPDDVFNAELGDGVILFDSASNHITDNVIAHNGIFDGIGVLGGDADSNVIKGNTVEDTIGPADEGPAGQGIIVNAAGLGQNTGAVILDTLIEDNLVRRNGSAGLANINNVDAQILRNVVLENGLRNLFGNGIGIQLGPRPDISATRALVEGNEVHGNGVDGIQINVGATGNRIINNNAADNNKATLRRQFRGFDLHDRNDGRDLETGVVVGTPCADNVWFGNVWGSGLFSPECVTAGGSGPPLPPPGPEGPFTGFGADQNPNCADRLDNDYDGLIDAYDPDCHPPTEGPAGDPTCSDGIDNNFDGDVDADDRACFIPDEEAYGPSDPKCSDGRDNDLDGLIDRDDPDCASVGEGRPGSRECQDGLDNDRDRLIDGDDPDCQAPTVEGRPGSRECNDGLDNDRDGLIDARDPDCQQP